MESQDRPSPSCAETERPELDPRNLIPVPTVTVDGGGRILWINRAAEELIGYTRDVIIGSSTRDWIHGRPRRRVVRDLLQWKRGTDDEISMEIPIRSAGNVARWAGLRVRRVAFRPGKPVFVASFYDLQGVHAERERLQKQVEALEARVHEAMAAVEMKSEFLRVAGEQIRIPMSGLIEMSHLLLDTELAPDQCTYAEIIAQSGGHLLEVVNDLLDFTRIESAALEIRNLDFDLRVTLDSVAEVLGGWVTDSGRKFAFTVEPSLATALQGDPGRLRQILLGLGRCLTSISAQGAVAVAVREVDETAQSVELRVQFRVEISTEDREDAELMRRAFSDGDSGALQRLASRGLSLRLSRQLISLMRGKIGAVHSTETELELAFQVPFAKQPSVAIPAEREVAPMPEPAPETWEGRRVLIADPFGRCGGIVVPVLELLGCEAIRVRSGEEVLSNLREAEAAGQPIGFAILDAVLPDKSLDAVCEEIHAESTWRVELLMTTSMGQPGDAEWASRLGFRAYLPMPIDADDLQEALREIVRSRSAERAGAESQTPLITRHWLAEQRLKARGLAGSPDEPPAAAPADEPDPAAIASGFRDWVSRPERSPDEWESFFGEERKAA